MKLHYHTSFCLAFRSFNAFMMAFNEIVHGFNLYMKCTPSKWSNSLSSCSQWCSCLSDFISKEHFRALIERDVLSSWVMLLHCTRLNQPKLVPHLIISKSLRHCIYQSRLISTNRLKYRSSFDRSVERVVSLAARVYRPSTHRRPQARCWSRLEYNTSLHVVPPVSSCRPIWLRYGSSSSPENKTLHYALLRSLTVTRGTRWAFRDRRGCISSSGVSRLLRGVSCPACPAEYSFIIVATGLNWNCAYGRLWFSVGNLRSSWTSSAADVFAGRSVVGLYNVRINRWCSPI